jgi:hypothetical protein
MFEDRVLVLLMLFMLFVLTNMLPDRLEILFMDRIEVLLDDLLRLPGLSLFSLFLLAFLARRAAIIIAETEKPADFVDRCSGVVLLAGRDAVKDLFLSGILVDPDIFVIGFDINGRTTSDCF